MFWVAFFMCLFMVYALSSWLTKLMAMSGYSLGSALSFVIALNLGAMFGAIFGGWLADKFHIKWVLVTMYALGGLFLYLMTIPMSTDMLYLVIGAVAFLNAEVVVFQVDVEIGQDQLLFDEVPDDPGHLVAVKFDDRVCHLDFLHCSYAPFSSPVHGQPVSEQDVVKDPARALAEEGALASGWPANDLQTLQQAIAAHEPARQEASAMRVC